MTAIGRNYFHVTLEGSAFKFEEKTSKPCTSGLAINTLQTIETILKQNLRLSNEQKGGLLAEETLLNLLETKTREIVEGYQAKVSKLFWVQRRLFSQEKALFALQKSIASQVASAKKQIKRYHLPSNTPSDVMRCIWGHLTPKDIEALASTDKEMKRDIDADVVIQAQELGYAGSDPKEAKTHLKTFFQEFKSFCSQPYAEKIRVYKKDGKELDLKASLAKLKSLKFEYAKTLFKSVAFYRSSFLTIEKYFLSVIKSNSSRVFPHFMNREEGDDTTFFHFAAGRGYKEEIQQLLKAGFDIHTRNIADETALHVAAGAGQKEIVKLLIAAGCDATIRQNHGKTALEYAILSGHKEIADVLNIRAYVNRQDAEGKTVLHYAVSIGRIEMVKFVLENGADVNSRDAGDKTALNRAASGGYKEIVQLLIEKGADIHARDASGKTALHSAVDWDKMEIAKILIKNRADVNCRDNNGKTPLHLAMNGYSRNNRAAFVEFLIANGADVNCRDNTGRTALHDAASKNLAEIAKFLIENGADVNCSDNDDVTALHIAVTRHCPDNIIRLLLGKGANVNCLDNNGRTPLRCAEINGYWVFNGYCTNYFFVAEHLLSSGADIDIQDRSGITVLHWAITHEYWDYISFLLRRGAKINIQDNFGRTALHKAVRADSLFFTKWLLQIGADATIKDLNEETALDYARSPEIAALFKPSRLSTLWKTLRSFLSFN